MVTLVASLKFDLVTVTLLNDIDIYIFRHKHHWFKFAHLLNKGIS